MTALTASAQFVRPAANGILSSLRPVIIQLSSPNQPASNRRDVPFSHYEVLDDRPDTTRIGIQGNLPMRSHAFDRQIVFRNSAPREIAGFLNQHFARSGAPDTCVIVLRCLWLSDTDPFTDNPDPGSEQDIPKFKGHIRLRAELYARRGNRYMPLIRIDTLQPGKLVYYSILRSTYLGWEKELAAVFTQLAQKASLAFARREEGGRWITWDQVRRFNQTRFDIPIFDSVGFRRGVYAGFEEFRNNDPSIHDFEVLPENGNLALYIKNDDGTSYYTHDAWGFCNGKQVFLMHDGLLHLLHKDGNLFYFYGIDIPAADLLSLPVSVFTGSQEQHCIYIVDMDTGQFY